MRRMTGTRVTARIVQTADGETHKEYTVGGVAYCSLEAVQAALGGR